MTQRERLHCSWHLKQIQRTVHKQYLTFTVSSKTLRLLFSLPVFLLKWHMERKYLTFFQWIKRTVEAFVLLWESWCFTNCLVSYMTVWLCDVSKLVWGDQCTVWEEGPTSFWTNKLNLYKCNDSTELKNVFREAGLWAAQHAAVTTLLSLSVLCSFWNWILTYFPLLLFMPCSFPLIPSSPIIPLAFIPSSISSPSLAPGYWSISCRLSEGPTTTRWRRCVASCRMWRRRTTVSSSSWLKTSSCLQRPESKPVCSTRSPASPTRTWYAAAHMPIHATSSDVVVTKNCQTTLIYRYT